MMTLGSIFDPNRDMQSFGYDVPTDFSNALETTAPGVNQIIDSQKSVGENWYDSLARLLPTLAATYQQKQLLDVQVQRARAGQPPLNVSNYAPGINVGVNQDTQKLLVYAALGLGALFVFSTFMKNK
jgi:hypothetical protein